MEVFLHKGKTLSNPEMREYQEPKGKPQRRGKRIWINVYFKS